MMLHGVIIKPIQVGPLICFSGVYMTSSFYFLIPFGLLTTLKSVLMENIKFIVSSVLSFANEPEHEKPNKMTCAPSKDEHPSCLISLSRGLYGQLRTQTFRRTAKTDQTGQMPRLIWVFTGCTGYFVGIVMLRLKYSGNGKGKEVHNSHIFEPRHDKNLF